ncbi:uncharacterized protein LOC136085175 [Hydra vulgaris]|uniref:Uncharacterized protein LOC136085175 n=1 Tax=Hydra vulgaris TaxID=6087 RepID=A0ABM4CL76_HYDVU
MGLMLDALIELEHLSKKLQDRMFTTRAAHKSFQDKENDPKKEKYDNLTKNLQIFDKPQWFADQDPCFGDNDIRQLAKTLNICEITAVQGFRECISTESFRSDESFEAIIKKSEEIAIKLGTEPVFPQVRLSRKRRFFEYEGTDTPLNGKSKYKVDFFNAIIDVALVSLNERFKMLDSYNKILGFLTRTKKMRSLDANELLNDYKNLEISLRNPSTEESDVNHEELYSEINTFLRMEASAESKDALEILKYITANSLIETFPNSFIALRILLTSPISVASAERSFSKLKLIKNFLRSTTGQDRLSALALISIENKISWSLDCSDLIDEFASLKVRKVKF